MDLWESSLIYSPVSGPCRSVRGPGEGKSWKRMEPPPPPAGAAVGVTFLVFLTQCRGFRTFCFASFCWSSAKRIHLDLSAKGKQLPAGG